MKNIIMWFCILVFLTACGDSKPANNSDQKSSEQNEEQGVSESTENLEQPEQEIETPVLKTSEVAVIKDFAEIKVVNSVFGKVINPPNPGSFFTYYENEEINQTYLDITIAVKSLLTNGKSSDEFVDVKILYDNKYEYTTFSTIEDGGGSDFTYSNITSIEPLQTGTLHFLASVPVEIEKDGKPVKAIISSGGNKYEYLIR